METRDRRTNLAFFAAALAAWLVVGAIVLTRDPVLEQLAGDARAAMMGGGGPEPPAAPAPRRPPPPPGARRRRAAAVEASRDEILALSHWTHASPEPAFEEHR